MVAARLRSPTRTWSDPQECRDRRLFRWWLFADRNSSALLGEKSVGAGRAGEPWRDSLERDTAASKPGQTAPASQRGRSLSLYARHAMQAVGIRETPASTAFRRRSRQDGHRPRPPGPSTSPTRPPIVRPIVRWISHVKSRPAQEHTPQKRGSVTQERRDGSRKQSPATLEEGAITGPNSSSELQSAARGRGAFADARQCPTI